MHNPVQDDVSAPGIDTGARSPGEVRAARRLVPQNGRPEALQRLAELAGRLLEAPSAQVSLLTEVQTVVGGAGSALGMVATESALCDSLCTVTAAAAGPLIVGDARGDRRVSGLPPVAAGAVGSYLGVPLRSDSGETVGALCVYGPDPHSWRPGDVTILEQLAASVVAELELAALSQEYDAGRARWELAIDAAGIGGFDLDLVSGQLSWDDRLLELFGFERGSVDPTAEAFNARVHPDDRARITRARREAVDTVGTYEVEYRLLLPSGRTRWIQARGRTLADNDGRAVRLLGMALDVTELRRGALLAEVTSGLTGTLDAEEAAGLLARLVVPALADWCVVSLVDDEKDGPLERRMHDVGWWHADPGRRPAVAAYARLRLRSMTGPTYLGQVLETGRHVELATAAAGKIAAVLDPGAARDLLLELAPESAVIAPLRAHGRTLGLVTLFRDPGSASPSPEEVRTTLEVAARAGIALDNARMYARQRELAEALQRSLLTAPPRTALGEIVVRYTPAAETAQVGGDWYDAFVQGDGATVLVIGDVVGHDTAAAAAMGQVRGLLRGIAATTGEGPAGVLARLDEAMELLEVATTATAVVLRLEPIDTVEAGPGGTRVCWSNAGHPPPLAVAADGGVTVLGADDLPDLLLGVDRGSPRRESAVSLERGATVLLYTDGLVERRHQSLDDGLAELRSHLSELAGRSLDELCDEILRRMLPAAPEDDVALVAVRLDPPG